MSGVARQVGKLFKSDDAPAPAPAQTSAPTEKKPAARMSSPEERALALRRRRGSRALLSEERINAESGLGGDQTTLGGM